MSTMTPRTLALVMLAPLLIAGAAGCSDDPADTAGATTTSTTSSDHHSGEEHDVVEVTAVDFSFEDLPDRIDAGTRLTLRSDAPSELHELVAFRLPDDETRSVEELLALPEPDLGAVLGAEPPRTVLLAPPGGQQIPAVGDGTIDEPGRYLIMCSIPTGVDPATYLAAAAQSQGAPPQVDGGPPHFVHGMAAELTVE
jgi:hypothetical protein